MTPGLGADDVIGNDVAGMYAAIEARGFDTYIFTLSVDSIAALPTYHYADATWLLDSSDDLMLYHSAPETPRRYERATAAPLSLLDH
jgi:hypothetical protein